MKFKDFENKLLQDPEFKEEYLKHDTALDIALMVMEARIKKGLTQNDLARKMNTKQSAIARVESGAHLPSLTFLEKMAEALDTELIAPSFAFMEEAVVSVAWASENSDMVFLTKEANFAPKHSAFAEKFINLESEYVR